MYIEFSYWHWNLHLSQKMPLIQGTITWLKCIKKQYTNLILLLCGFPSRRCPILLLQPLLQLRHLTGQVKYWSGNRVLEMFSISLDNWSFRLLSVLYTRCGFLAERTVVLFNSLSIAVRSCSYSVVSFTVCKPIYLMELNASISRHICANLALRMSSALSNPSIKESINISCHGR